MWAHNLDLEFVRVTEATALASARLMGRGDEAAAQKAAVTTMHDLLSRGPLRCRVVVGEGEPGQVSRSGEWGNPWRWRGGGCGCGA